MKTKICECCGAFFEVCADNQVYCSIRCRRTIESKTAYVKRLTEKLEGMRAKLATMERSPERLNLEWRIKRAEATLESHKRFLLGYDQRGLDCNERTEQDSYMPEAQRLLRRDEVARQCGCSTPQSF